MSVCKDCGGDDGEPRDCHEVLLSDHSLSPQHITRLKDCDEPSGSVRLTDCSRENYRYFLIPRLYSALSSTITDAGFGGAKLSFVTLEYN